MSNQKADHNKVDETSGASTTPKSEKSLSEPKLKSCFVIMPISDHSDYEVGHFQRVYDYIIKPACEIAGFLPKRADDVKSSNVIIIDILERILSSEMAICDLSSKNPNVLYELGIRQSFDLPVTLIKDELTDRIFDINTFRDVPYHSKMRIDQVEKAVSALSDSIKETFENKGKEVNSIIELLGRTKAKIIPTEISNDTKILLDAINDTNRRINRVIDSPAAATSIVAAHVILPNRHTVEINQRIHHRTFGGGLVRKIILQFKNNSNKDGWDEGQIVIDFDKFGTKTLLLNSDGMLLTPETRPEDLPF